MSRRDELGLHGRLVEEEQVGPWDFIKKKSYLRRIVEELKNFVPNYNEDELYQLATPISKVPQISKLNIIVLASALSIFYRNEENVEDILDKKHKAITSGDLLNVKRQLRKYKKDEPKGESADTMIRLDIVRYLKIVFDVYQKEPLTESIEYETESSLTE